MVGFAFPKDVTSGDEEVWLEEARQGRSVWKSPGERFRMLSGDWI